MAVNIDTVYQRVLAFANKEQRGYVTPQEFNLFANQAQKEIFEQYFYDQNQLDFETTNNQTIHVSDEKLRIFEKSVGPATINSWVGAGGGGINKQVPNEVYRISRVEYNGQMCEILRTGDYNDAKVGGPLTRPTDDRPIANIRATIMRVVKSNNESITPTGVIYFRIPAPVSWGYFVIGDKALYDGNADKTKHFELHPAEETELIYKILKFAGISMKREDIMRAGQILEQAQVQQEKQ